MINQKENLIKAVQDKNNMKKNNLIKRWSIQISATEIISLANAFAIGLAAVTLIIFILQIIFKKEEHDPLVLRATDRAVFLPKMMNSIIREAEEKKDSAYCSKRWLKTQITNLSFILKTGKLKDRLLYHSKLYQMESLRMIHSLYT